MNESIISIGLVAAAII